MSRTRTILAICAVALVAVAIQFGARAYWASHAVAQQGGPNSVADYPPSDEQLASLADGVVTEEEVRAALTKAADCLEASGVQAVRVGHPQLEGNLELMTFVPDGGDFAKANTALRECSVRHSAAVTSAYRAQHRGSTPSNPVLGDDGWPVDGPAKPQGWQPRSP